MNENDQLGYPMVCEETRDVKYTWSRAHGLWKESSQWKLDGSDSEAALHFHLVEWCVGLEDG